MNQKALLDLASECGFFLPSDFTSRILRIMNSCDDYEFKLLEAVLYYASKSCPISLTKHQLIVIGEMKYIEVRP